MSIELRYRLSLGAFSLDIDIAIPQKGVTALFGPSGCGKTTILRAVAGLDRYPGGFLKLGDAVWQDRAVFLPPHRRSVGYVFQDARLFPHLNVEKNLLYGLSRTPAAQRRVSLERAVSLLGIGGLLDRYPDKLSGGECQRVAIARALACSPEILLLDEPLAALDVTRKDEILPYFESLHSELEIPVLYVSHSTDEVARIADHIVCIDSGRVNAIGPAHEMLTRLDQPLSHDENAESILDGTVVSHDTEYRLTVLDTPVGIFYATKSELPIGRKVRLRMKARDISITLAHQTDTSILNIFSAVVEELDRENSAQQLVRLSSGNRSILARLTRKSICSLGLQPGMPVFIQVKSVALMP